MRQLVEEADANTGAAAAQLPRADDLLSALAAHGRRRTRRRGVAALAVAAIGFVALQATSSRQTDAPLVRQRSSANVGEVAGAREALARLNRAAELKLQVIRGLANVEGANSQRAADRNVAPSAGADEFAQEVARSAAISWRYAALVEQQFGDVAAARREYERIAARFPGTVWAGQATESLRRLPEIESFRSL
jgi:hypothetical protein